MIEHGEAYKDTKRTQSLTLREGTNNHYPRNYRLLHSITDS
jgi:hypothetical protein